MSAGGPSPHADGRFFLEHLSIGGPYRIEVHALGFAPATQHGIFLSLSERDTTASAFAMWPWS